MASPMTLIGGPKTVTDLVVQRGATPGPRSVWAGSWVLKSGYNQFPTFFDECKRDGTTPIVKHWVAGDDLSIAFLKNGAQDRYQNVWKTPQHGVDIAAKVAEMAKAAGVDPLFCIELEWNKGDAISAAGAPLLQAYLENVRKAIKAAHPGARTVYSPGDWGDIRVLTTTFKTHASNCDALGLQALKFPSRHSRADYLGSVDRLAASFAAMRSVVSQKPAIIYDCAWSTYAGGSTTHPFPNGDPTAYDQEQRTVLERLVALAPAMSLEAIVLRDLKDNPNFATSNYGGYAERHLGYVRADGTTKPAYGPLLALIDASADGADGIRAEIAELQGRLAEMEKGIGSMITSTETLRQSVAAVEKRIKRAGITLTGNSEPEP